ncbi:MAG TPA: site-specific integrase [Candidatus Acidoferrales bacterium]|nr:site-specific integrase [Candidatus Acidoferrales bacterium]
MTKTEAQECERELLRKLDASLGVDDGSMTVARLLVTWLTDNEHRLAATTWESYESKARIHVLPLLGMVKLKNLKPKHIVDAYAKIRKKKLSSQTLTHIHRMLHTAFVYGKKTLRVVDENILDDVPAPQICTRELPPLCEAQVRSIIEAAKGTRLEVPVLVAALTGLRRSEILGLRWCDVHFERGVLTVMQVVEQSRRFGVRVKEKTKNRSSRRVIPIAAELLEVLRRYQAQREAARPAYFADHDLVFCNDDGSPWPPDTFTRQFAEIAALVGLRGTFRFHDQRHAFATIALRNGVSVKEVSTLLGHSSPIVTMSTYARQMEGLGRAAVDGLAKSLLEPGEVGDST